MTAALHAESIPTNVLASRKLVSEQLWDRLASRITREHDVDRPFAERIIDQTLTFLRVCADFPGKSYAPSPMVDIGWHTFILYTREYADFCQRLAGRFIHHEPTDESKTDSGATIADTVAALRTSGAIVDETLWFSHNDPTGTCEAHECRTVAAH